MKKLFLIIIVLCITVSLQAQVSKTVNVTAGGLSSSLTTIEKSTITNLTISGTIDARDFKTMRDEISFLSIVDLNGANIVDYTGEEGPGLYGLTYPANEIPQYAFRDFDNQYYGKISLTSFICPKSTTSIRSSAFSDCTGLTSIVIPESVTSIDQSAFMGCKGLTSVTIPSSVTSIKQQVFDGCSSLNSVTIPSSVTSIGVYAFSGCNSLNSITIPSSVTSFSRGAFRNCTRLTSFTIPSLVTSMDEYVFSGCTGITSIAIPKSVTSIGSYAFYGCIGLTSIYTYSDSPIDLSFSYNVFREVNKTTCTLYVPAGSKNAYMIANQWKDFNMIEEFSTTYASQIREDQVSVYPNPLTDGFQVKGITGTSTLSLFDINGKLLLTKEIDSDEYVYVSTLPQGVYVIRISSETGTLEKKLVKN